MSTKACICGLTKFATFNFPEQRRAVCCKQCKLEGMVNVRNSICAEADCRKEPVFNYSQYTRGMYCADHALIDMVNVRHRVCMECSKVASFNYKGQRASYCKEHMLDGMIYTKNKLCRFEGCDIMPIFNFVGQKSGLYCIQHKEEGMINVHLKR